MIFDEFAIRSAIQIHRNSDAPGGYFIDMSGIYSSPLALHMVANAFTQKYLDASFTHIIAIDSGGYNIGALLAYSLNKPLVLMRKMRPLPGSWITEASTNDLRQFMIKQGDLSGGESALLIDDLVATGETMGVASTLAKQVGAEVTDLASIANLAAAGGVRKLQELEIPFFSAITLETD